MFAGRPDMDFYARRYFCTTETAEAYRTDDDARVRP